MNKILSTTLISVTLALTSVAASAEESATMAKPASAAAAKPNKFEAIFNRLDKNHDGMIDTKEAKHDKPLYRSFKKLAKNGKLDKEGFMKWEKMRHHHHKAKHKAKHSEEKKS